MPFATAPYCWGILSEKLSRDFDRQERAHGDGMLVDGKSPESFEEVFRRTRADLSYIKMSTLEPHTANASILADYRRYIANVLTGAPSRDARYLCKNTNNLLRVGSILEAHADALIIVPFRNPLDHAGSLLRQHQRFCEIHREDAFARKYMTWLGHHEFGLAFKPFHFSDRALPQSFEETLTLPYWLRYWGVVYEHLLRRHREDVLFFDYDQLVARPSQGFSRLADILSVPRTAADGLADRVESRQTREDVPEALRETYQGLREISL